MSTYSNTDAPLRATLHIMLLAREWWLKLNFSRKLAGVATVAVCCGVAIVGNIATYQVRSAMVRDSAASIALYMDSFIAPHVQELANASLLSDLRFASVTRDSSASAEPANVDCSSR